MDVKSSKQPLVSIIVTSYNYENYIRETLNSILAQTYKNYEVVIVDDGSQDNSLKVINEYTEKYDNFKLYTHPNNENKGLIESVKLGIYKANGEWIAFCESDDYWTEDYLQEKINYINTYKNCYLVSNDIQTFGTDKLDGYIQSVRERYNSCTLPQNFFAEMYNYNGVLPTFSAVFIKRDILNSLDFNSVVPEWLDWWLWRQYSIKYNIGYIDKKLTFWRIHDKSYDSVAQGDYATKAKKLVTASDKLLKKKYPLKWCSPIFFKYLRKCAKTLFSVRNSEKRTHKIICILGIKISIKRRTNS